MLAYLAIAYLLAAVPFALVVSTLWGGDEDVRTSGSGNPGATNVARLYGWKLGGPVMALDICKGLVPVLGARLLWPDLDVWFAGPVAIVVFLAHCFPVYLEFRGGKGVATGAGAMLALAPIPTLIAAVIWIGLVLLTGRASVAGMASALALVGLTFWIQPAMGWLVLLLAIAVLATHTPNIRRLWRGQESKVVRATRWSRRPGGNPLEALQEGPAGVLHGGAAWSASAPSTETPDT
ncbi:MAG: glycerol-3-phosphate acyltransferase PlsY [Kiritimatiellia bacterium]|jgi:glycerol-3-phosphate acyltransferase PlsY